MAEDSSAQLCSFLSSTVQKRLKPFNRVPTRRSMTLLPEEERTGRSRMKNAIRAWKDPIYRATLSAAGQAELVSPVGIIELTGTELDYVSGGGHGSGKGCGSGKS